MAKKNEFWKTQICLCSAIEKSGFEEIWNLINKWYTLASSENILRQRKVQDYNWFQHLLEDRFKNYFYQNKAVHPLLQKLKFAMDRCQTKSYEKGEKLNFKPEEVASPNKSPVKSILRVRSKNETRDLTPKSSSKSKKNSKILTS